MGHFWLLTIIFGFLDGGGILLKRSCSKCQTLWNRALFPTCKGLQACCSQMNAIVDFAQGVASYVGAVQCHPTKIIPGAPLETRWGPKPCSSNLRKGCWTRTRQTILDVSRETPDVTTKPKCYDLTDILVHMHQWCALSNASALSSVSGNLMIPVSAKNTI